MPEHWQPGRKELFSAEDIDKEGFERTINLAPRAVAVLERRAAALSNGEGLLFGKYQRALRGHWFKAAKAAGIENRRAKKISVYDFRHAAVKRFRDASGGDARGVGFSIELIDVQDRLAGMSSGKFYANNPIDILRRATKPIIDEYDLVLIDCPPNLGIITLNGLRIAQGYVVPTIPDVLSTYGIPQIKTRVAAFAENIGDSIDPLGIIVNKYREQSTVHRDTLKRLSKMGIPIFKTIIPENNQIAGSAEYAPISTLRQKYGYQGQYDSYVALTKEFLQILEAHA
jgi:cellulose biosynthesis protein BcsQ